MNNVTRWVQSANHSLKRSISAVTSQSPGQSPHSYIQNGTSATSLNKNWIHPPDVLLYARVEYTVKFLGDVSVPQAKGTEVIKAAIQKLRFNLEVKRSQGFKLPRVELHVNLDGVMVVDAKSHMVLHKYPLHRISFCADDKNDKRLFAFIAKQSAESDEHRCFVFLSDKLAEEITLTIGEAFDLAYRKFLENNGRDLELKKLVVVLRKRISELEHENADLKQKLAQQQRAVSQQNNAVNYESPASGNFGSAPLSLATSSTGEIAKTWESFDPSPEAPLPPSSPVPPPPPNLVNPPSSTKRQNSSNNNILDVMRDLSTNGPEVGKRLENLQLSNLDDIFDQDFDPRAGEISDKINNGVKSRKSNDNVLLFGAASSAAEPSAEDLEQAISMIDIRMAEMREGFKRGISFGNDDFHISDFDTLNPNPPNGQQ